MHVLVWFHLKEIRWTLADDQMELLRARFPQVTFTQALDEESLAHALPQADAFFGFEFPAELFASAGKLRWIQCANAGVERTLFHALVESDVVVTNAAGIHSVNIPEHALALVFALTRNLHVALRLKAERRWDRVTAIAGGAGVRELSGTNLAVLGAGAIGLGVARRAAALGMRVRVMRRRPGRPIEGVEAVVGADQLHTLLAWADVVVVATPLTRETRHLIDAAALAAMKRSAYLVNVGRGEIIDEAALVAALRAGTIAGAGLDAFAVEPLPDDSPLWTLENVILTPHVSGYMPDFHAKVTALFADNLERSLAGEPLRNLVDKRLGYAPT